MEKVQRRFTKMITNMEGLRYENRLRCLNLWSLEERVNKQYLIEVSTMSQKKSIIELQDLFILEKNNKGTRGHSLKLTKMRCTWDCWKHFFFNRMVNRWNKRNQQLLGATSLNAFKNGLNKLRKTKIGFFMDWSAKPQASLVGVSASETTQGELQGEFILTIHCILLVVTIYQSHLIWSKMHCCSVANSLTVKNVHYCRKYKLLSMSIVWLSLLFKALIKPLLLEIYLVILAIFAGKKPVKNEKIFYR